MVDVVAQQIEESFLELFPLALDEGNLAEAMYACCLTTPRIDHAQHVLAHLARPTPRLLPSCCSPCECWE